jgi:hypothetical protein
MEEPRMTPLSLIDRSRELITQRIEICFESCAESSRVAIFGCNDIGRLAARIGKDAGHNIVSIVDSFSQHKVQDGLPVRTPKDQLEDVHPDAIMLATLVSATKLASVLRELGFEGTILELGDDLMHLSPSVLHPCSAREVFESYRNRHAAQPGVVIGNGPSLLETDPRLLSGVVTFGGNGIHLLENFEPDYYIAVDQRIDIWGDTVARLPWTKFLAPHLRELCGEAVYFPVRMMNNDSLSVEDIYEDGIETGHSIVHIMLQLAFFMGCDPVYIIGCVHTYWRRKGHVYDREDLNDEQDPDSNHFDKRYIPAEKVKDFKHATGVEIMEVAFGRSKRLYERAGRSVYNATRGGHLEVFERCDFEDIVSRHCVASGP